MNRKSSLLTLAAMTAVAGQTVVKSLKIHRQERKKREQIEHEKQLDLIAIRRAGDLMKKELDNGMHDHLSLGQMLEVLNQRIEFERITIRLED
jgi:hypothetical protein